MIKNQRFTTIANSIFNGWDVPSSDNFYLNANISVSRESVAVDYMSMVDNILNTPNASININDYPL